VTTTRNPIHLGSAVYPEPDTTIGSGFATIDGEQYARIDNVGQMPPFLMNIVSDSDFWLFVGSNGPFTAGRNDPDTALFPYQTVDKLVRDASTSGARTSLLVTRGGDTALWEPWLVTASVYRIGRNLYKRIDGTEVLFEEVNHDLGLRFRWSLAASDQFGLVRRAELEDIAGEPAHVRYLDGFHQVMPPGVGQDTYARLSYLAAAYMRHERVAGTPYAVYALNAAISDRAEASESLRVAGIWSVGHPDPVVLLSDRQVAAFRRGGEVQAELEVRGEIGAYLAVDEVALEPNGRHSWYTVGDTGLDHAAVQDALALLATPSAVVTELDAAIAANRAGIRRRVAGADGLQHTADEAATANHFSNVLFNIMRGGSFDDGYRIPLDDLEAYLRSQNRAVLDRCRGWVARLPEGLSLQDLRGAADQLRDPQLIRLVRSYLPLTFSRRHGDPSRPWNRFSIRLRDDTGRPVFGYEGNWRDIFQNWEALGLSYPGFLPHFISAFLDASTADGYNPYRITRSGIDWEVEDPRDPWSHIGYWGDHQIVYLLRLLEALERYAPGQIGAALRDRLYAYANVPYRIRGLEAMLADPRVTIDFDRDLHEELVAAAVDLGADGKLLRDADGEVRLVTLGEKLLVPLLVKLTNFVPGGGTWLNTQRPEWNDANNALAGWGLSVVTLSAIRRYLLLLGELSDHDAVLPLSGAVALLMERVTRILDGVPDVLDDAARYRVMVELGRAGEAHRRAAYAGDLGEDVATPLGAVRALVDVALPAIDRTLRASRRADGLYHSYNLLRVDRDRASVQHLGPMLEGQVAILESGLLDGADAVALLRALRASDMYRPDQHSYLLYPDRALTPFLARNTLKGEPPTRDPALFAADRTGAWHFQADLSTIGDVQRQLDRLDASPDVRAAVLELWRSTFAHDEFTGRSGSFFMFEGLGSVYWHMIAKLLLATEASQRRAVDPATAAELRELYDDIRDGLNFRKTAASFGAFPTDAHSHTPSHRGAQQPGMTGQVKEQILTRFGELGVDVVEGRLRFDPRLLHLDEFSDEAWVFDWLDVAGTERSCSMPSGSLAFTCCQVPVCYLLDDASVIWLERADGLTEVVEGSELDREASLAIFERRGTYTRVTVGLPRARWSQAGSQSMSSAGSG